MGESSAGGDVDDEVGAARADSSDSSDRTAECRVCGLPMDPALAAAGIDQHPSCGEP